MSRSPFAEINPKILLWARQTSGLDTSEASRKIGTSIERIEAWEKGGIYPTVKQLRKLAKVYMRPIGLFFLPELPDDPSTIKDFRRIADPELEEMTSALRFEIRLAHKRRTEAIELSSDLGESPPIIDFKISLRDDPDRVAKDLRDFLGLSVDSQYHWNTKYQAFDSWRSAIENTGVLVFQTGVLRNLIVDPAEARGFSISDRPYPLIVVNGKDHPTAKCFTLIHELTHILLEDGGICDFHDSFRSSSHIDQAEVFCNRVAGAVLVPSEALLNNDIVRNHGKDSTWTNDELSHLSRRFWVSWEVILRRLLTLNKTTRNFYQRWRTESKDVFPGRNSQPEIKIPAHTRVKIRNGKLLPRLVFRALRGKVITIYEACNILDTKPHRLVDVENAVY